MTYAELYGNIKKRPLKYGLHNKMILDVSSNLSSVVDPLANITLGVSDAIADMSVTNHLEPVVKAATLSLDDRLQGI